MNYKDTLNLPKTEFPMKANLSVREPDILSLWEKLGLYEKMREDSAGRKSFILHDGPPYANGHIHTGHALNKILKDIVVRYKTLRGYNAPYVPGWDCHGLPVEHQLFKDLKKNKDQVDRVEFRRMAFEYAMKYVNIQRDEFKRLGVLGDWANPYLTLDKSYEHAILSSFSRLVEKGFVYRGLKPVNWCFKCETALAEAEVEYADHESDSVFVKFRIQNNDLSKRLGLLPDKENFILIWTTTPWTLIANVAVAVSPNMDYFVLSDGKTSLVLAKDQFEASLKDMPELAGYKVLSEFKGAGLEGLLYDHPFGLRQGRVVLADYVSREDGTGCVHTAPGHGQEDFMTGLKYKLDIVMPVDERGCFRKDTQDFASMHVFKANAAIIEKLKSGGLLLSGGKISHTYPHCWRCKSPIIFRATQQWFLKIDHKGLREKLMASIAKDIKWVPVSGRERISAMVGNRPDWCLSRQRYWGVPIPAVVCKKCGEHILEPSIIDKVADCVSKEGTDAWFLRDINDFLPSGFKCRCSGNDFERSEDILDVWFDSGVSHQAVLKTRPQHSLPADLYLEGSDQHRGWFQTSLIPSMAIDEKPPYSCVLTHGFVVDADGRKMSKSLGNVISPQEIIKEFGADILRLWVCQSDYNEDVRISKEILNLAVDSYRKIRNTLRFLLGNLNDFEPQKDRLDKNKMLEIDRWALYKLSVLIKEASVDFDAYKFYQAFQKIYKFCNEDMSSLYLDILKDRLYTAGKKSDLRRSAQTALYEVLSAITRLIAPVCPFTAEEVYRFSSLGRSEKCVSVQLSGWPAVSAGYETDFKEVKGIDLVLSFRASVLKALEARRAEGLIGSPLEAKISLFIKETDVFNIFSKFSKELPFIFIVSEAEVVNDLKAQQDFTVTVEKASGQKCPRCWNYSNELKGTEEYPGICPRCVTAVSGV